MGKPVAYDTHPYIDRYLNRLIPSNQIFRLPKPISRFLGYREHPHREPPEYLVWVWAFIGPFCGIALVEGVFKSSPVLQSHHPPLIIASFGAAAILSYNAIESPLAQPRNAFFGHILSAVVGVGVTKLFRLSSNFEDIQWLAGAVACAAASTVTGMLNVRYPPGGAAALLAATSTEIVDLGWYFVALVTLATVLMLASALVLNNIQRQYPKWWWTPTNINRDKVTDIEKATRPDGQVGSSKDAVEAEKERKIIITPDRILLPDDIELEGEEQRVVEQLLQRLRLPRDGRPSMDTQRTEFGESHKDKDTFFFDD